MTSKDIACSVLGTNDSCIGLAVRIKNLLVEVKETRNGQGFVVEVFENDTDKPLGSVFAWNEVTDCAD